MQKQFFGWGRAKIGEKQSGESNKTYNFMQYVFFRKCIYGVQWDLGQSPQKLGELLRIFVLNVTLHHHHHHHHFCKCKLASTTATNVHVNIQNTQNKRDRGYTESYRVI